MTGKLVALRLVGSQLILCACGLQRPLPTAAAHPTPLPVVADLSGVTAEGRLEPVRFVELSPAWIGLVSEVPVIEGE